MDKSNVITLIGNNREQDEYGRWTATPIQRQVFCQVDSVTQREFFEGGRNGLNPEFKFTMFKYDYNNEPIVEYNGFQYSVYRTFVKRNDEIELYVERKGGTNKAEIPSA